MNKPTPITREEFIEMYCSQTYGYIDVPLAELEKRLAAHGRVVVKCSIDCDHGACRGWRMEVKPSSA